jgi:hypothetical protein
MTVWMIQYSPDQEVSPKLFATKAMALQCAKNEAHDISINEWDGEAEPYVQEEGENGVVRLLLPNSEFAAGEEWHIEPVEVQGANPKVTITPDDRLAIIAGLAWVKQWLTDAPVNNERCDELIAQLGGAG